MSDGVDHAMIEELGDVSDDEIRDPKVHARKCGPRFRLLAAMAIENGEQARQNADAIKKMQASVIRVVIGTAGLLGILVLFGRERGADIIMRLIERL